MNFLQSITVTLLVGLFVMGISSQLNAQEKNVSELVKKAQGAGIEQASITELQSRAEKRGISDQQFASILETAINMNQNNLPANVAIQKALEGFSKGVPANRIITVVDKVHQSLNQSVQIVDPWIQKPAVQEMIKRSGQSESAFRNELAEAASKSFMQNMSDKAVNSALSQIGDQSVIKNSSPSDIVAAVGILPDLQTNGSDTNNSGRFIARALKGGFKAKELQKLPSAIQMAQRRSNLPAAAVIEGVANQMSGNIPAKQILQNLFNGNVGGGPPGSTPKGLQDGGPDRGNGNGNGSGSGI